MKYAAALLQILLLGLLAFAGSPKSAADPHTSKSFLINVIEGTVYDPGRQPVPDLWIELQNDFYLNVMRVRSESSGRFTFRGIGPGHYYIKVYTSGTNFEEQTVGVDVVNLVQNSSDTVYQDVVLKLRKGLGIGIQNMTDAIFVQEIPPDAKKLYTQGAKDLYNKDPQVTQRGQEELEQAIKIFPDYYDALNALGCNYVATEEYQKSFPYLIRAIDVNQRSFSSYYSLAYAAYKLNHLPEAGNAARAATILQPNSVNAQLLYGSVLRLTGSLDKALETLLKAEKLSKDFPIAEIHWQLALLLNRLNRNDEAAAELEKYLKIEPEVTNKKQVQDLIEKLKTRPKQPTGTSKYLP